MAISSSSLTVAATGVHRFTVDGYSITKKLAAVGDYYQSEQFTVGGHAWAVRYYPTTLGSCEFYLIMLSRPPAAARPVGVTFSCTPLDRCGQPSAGAERRLSKVFYRGEGHDMVLPGSFGEEVTQSDEYVAGDRFAVQCTVSVLKKPIRLG